VLNEMTTFAEDKENILRRVIKLTSEGVIKWRDVDRAPQNYEAEFNGVHLGFSGSPSYALELDHVLELRVGDFNDMSLMSELEDAVLCQLPQPRVKVYRVVDHVKEVLNKLDF